jgi:hypothetical protein
MKRARSGFSLLFLLVAPSAALAQPAWDSPMLMPPRVSDGLGVLLMEAHGGGVGGLVTWRAPAWNFGVRAGLVDGVRDDIGLLAGIDVNGTLTRSTDEFPLDIDWVFGAGIGVDDGARISLPLGLSVGHTFVGDGVTFLPYATPRVILDAFINDDDDDPPRRRNNDDIHFGVAVDLGLDLRVTPAFLIRFAATVGDREGVALGLVF